MECRMDCHYIVYYSIYGVRKDECSRNALIGMV